LHWKDQYSFHGGVEHRLTESTLIRFGYAHANDPVPSSTLTPLTAAIMSNQFSTGFAYQPGHSRFELAYSFHPTAEAHVQQSSLLSGEYNDSTVRMGTQTVALGYSLRF
jgi:long-chain fatty acid transport protein